jgi:hypothetical protein
MLLGTGQGLLFEGVTTGVDSTATGTAHFNLIDSSAKNTKTVFAGAAAAVNTVVLQNVQVDSTVPAVSLFSNPNHNIEDIDLFTGRSHGAETNYRQSELVELSP